MTDQEMTETHTRRKPEPTSVQIQIEDSGCECGWRDLCSDNEGRDPIVFEDGVSEARAYMKGHVKSCRFRIITIRGPYNLEIEQTTKATITAE